MCFFECQFIQDEIKKNERNNEIKIKILITTHNFLKLK